MRNRLVRTLTGAALVIGLSLTGSGVAAAQQGTPAVSVAPADLISLPLNTPHDDHDHDPVTHLLELLLNLF